jgi:hypothetical protein
MARVQHIVLVKFKPEATAAKIAEVFTQLAELRRVISGLEQFRGGPYSSPEGLNQGFTHGFIMTFSNSTARDNYLTHPEHERVKEDALHWVDAVIAFDFEES